MSSSIISVSSSFFSFFNVVFDCFSFHSVFFFSHTMSFDACCCLSIQKNIRLTNIRTLDLSSNQLKTLSVDIIKMKNLKSLNMEGNKLTPGTLAPIAQLANLQHLQVGNNLLGRPTVEAKDATPLPSQLPKGLKTLNLSSNYLSSIPPSIVSNHLTKLDKLDLSCNQLASIPVEISNLKNLSDLNLDDNSIVSLPEAIGMLSKLKVLSLRNNHISVHSTTWSDKNPQPLPQSLFTDTPIIDLNLHGNPMTSTQLNSMEGYDDFLERRQKVKTNALLGGALTNLDVCGLE